MSYISNADSSTSVEKASMSESTDNCDSVKSITESHSHSTYFFDHSWVSNSLGLILFIFSFNGVLRRNLLRLFHP